MNHNSEQCRLWLAEVQARRKTIKSLTVYPIKYQKYLSVEDSPSATKCQDCENICAECASE